jgi:hypothetical protein
MGNWRTVEIVGHICAADAPAARAFVEIGEDWSGGRFHCLCYTGPSLCGLDRWLPAQGGDIDAMGNLSERNYDVDDVAETLRKLVEIAPSLEVKVHCGGDWEDENCIATVTVHDGEVTIGAPEVEKVGTGMSERGAARMMALLLGDLR